MMKKFVIRFLLFLTPLLIVAYGADIFLSQHLKKRNNYATGEFSIWNDLFDGKVNSSIVIYGSSRAWVHIDPTMIGDSLHTTAYNLGIDGHAFDLQYLRHSILLEHNVKPKLIIQSVDIFTFEKRKDLYNLDQFLPYMLFNKKIKHATLSYVGYTHWDYEIPLIRYYGKLAAIKSAIKMFVQPTDNPAMRIRGYQGQDKSWNSDFDKAKAKMSSYKVKIDTGLLHLFERYLKQCQNEGIKIVFVYTPEYIEGQKFIENRHEIIALYKKFSEEYHIPLYNYSDDPISFKKSLFYNSLHLNKTGSELFTKKLIDTLKKTGVINSITK